jgi:hypothetical protein
MCSFVNQKNRQPMKFEEVVCKINRSTLSGDQQEGFASWLRERPYMQISIQQALEKGQAIKALLVSRSIPGRIDYILQIESQPELSREQTVKIG